MSQTKRTVIVGTGSYLPTVEVPNAAFLDHEFYDPSGQKLDRPTAEIIDKFEEITGIAARRHVSDDLVASDIACLAAQDALETAGTDPETLDQIIIAHNFGDVRADNRRSDFVPSLASRVKQRLGIRNPSTICFDLPFGCPGWLQGIIQADQFLRAGEAKRILVVGAETLSRVCDPHDRDSMIYADGAGATIVEAVPHAEPIGILGHAVRSDTLQHAHLLRMGRSYNPDYSSNELFLKLEGRKLYEYALKTVPGIVVQSLERAGIALGKISKILLHQANEKMDNAIVTRLCKQCKMDTVPASVVPTTISWLGNSSVATVPTLLDLLLKGKLVDQVLQSGDLAILASVGAGMNANSVIYRMP